MIRIHFFRALPALVLVLASSGGCSDTDGLMEEASIEVVDSAGVAVGRLVFEWHQVAQPHGRSLEVDTIVPPSAAAPGFGWISRGDVSSTGAIAIVDSIGRTVWEYRPQISPAWRRVVTAGEGPGDVGYPGGVWWGPSRSGTVPLNIYDGQRRRWVRYLDGEFWEDHRIPGLPENGSSHRATGPGELHFVEYSEYPDLTWDPGWYRAQTRVYSVNRNTENPRLIWQGPGDSWSKSEDGIGPTPFGPQSIIVSREDQVVVADSEAGVLRAFSPSGGPLWKLVLQATPLPLTEDLLDELVDSVATRFSGDVSNQVRLLRNTVKAMPVPESLPLIGGVFLTESQIWLSGYVPHPAPRGGVGRPSGQWVSIQLPIHSQSWLGRFRMPLGAVPIGSDGDTLVLVRLEDTLGRHGVGVVHLGEDKEPQY